MPWNLALSFIVTCKGRLSHLQRTLPALVAQAGTETVLVDFDCPEDAAGWARRHFPEVRVVDVEAQPVFHLSRARNLGAAVATADLLAFVDADTLVGPGFLDAVRTHASPDAYLQCIHGQTELSGSVVVPRQAFAAVGGYDEAFEGWGAEDQDLYLRLERRGLRRVELPAGALATIGHERALRTSHYRIKQAMTSWLVNRMYMELKLGLADLSGEELPLDSRRGLYKAVEAEVRSAQEQRRPPRFSVGGDWLPFLPGLEMQRTLTVQTRPMAAAP